MGWDLCSSPPWVPFYPYTMFQNPIPIPSCQKFRKTIITEKSTCHTKFSHSALCLAHPKTYMWRFSSLFKHFFPVKNISLNVSLTQRIEHSIGNESSSLKFIAWCRNTVDYMCKDMSKLVLSENSPYSICIHLVE